MFGPTQGDRSLIAFHRNSSVPIKVGNQNREAVHSPVLPLDAFFDRQDGAVLDADFHGADAVEVAHQHSVQEFVHHVAQVFYLLAVEVAQLGSSWPRRRPSRTLRSLASFW